MKQIKRIMAFALALVLTLAMSITVFAENPSSGEGVTLSQPNSKNVASITVYDVEEGATVTAYKYVKAVYSLDKDGTELGLQGYQLVEDVKDLDLTDDVITQPASTDIIALSNAVHDNKLQAESNKFTNDGTTYTASDFGAGTYLILVTNTKSEIYNPMIVSVFYNSEDDNASGTMNNLGDGSVSADYTIQKGELSDGEVYAKSSTPTVTKTVSEPDAAVGDTVIFTITTTIPDYTDAYKNKDTFTYKLTDTMATGFKYTDGTFKATDKDGNTLGGVTMTPNGEDYVIDLKDVALDHKNETVTITYDATLQERTAVKNTDASGVGNTNKVVLTYSTDPNTGAVQTAEKVTHTYTFNVENIITKVDSVNPDTKLAGAEFTLTRLDAEGNEVGTPSTCTTDATGDITFEGLDAGTYKLVETKAPKKYSLDGKVRTLEIKAEYDPDTGVITSLKYYLDDELIENIATIKNTTLASLPSTGGIGTTIFTIAGCLIMITAAGMYFASRRRSAK
jgi:fimbrial isopeptide formation D2 family protein/LPXTG-motif cell wall-anchored protein